MTKSADKAAAVALGAPWILRLRHLDPKGDNRFDMRPDGAVCKDLAGFLGLSALRKLRLAGTLQQLENGDWKLDAMLGATVVQPCVVTDEPVTTRLDVPVTRIFSRSYSPIPEEDESVFDGNDELEPLRHEIDMMAVLSESLSLAIPDYPRKADGTLEKTVSTPPDAAPIEEADTKPFASLAQLREKLQK